ncbi:MAG: TonB-dependent receptor [Myxococcales bacterium]|nr:TonB-dependent receptor [Myxococcales bacterium]
MSRSALRRVERGSKVRPIAIALLVAVIAPGTAASEDEDEEAALDGGLETLLVTAEKTEKDLQKTGGSVAMFSETMLDDRGIVDVKGISDYVPNLKIHTNPGGNTGFAINIRGAIKGDPIISREPVVGLYVDDVYMSNMVGVLIDYLDLEAIEVLRGPQGTLYGRNTNGGAVKVRTKAPSDVLSVRNDFSYGNFDLFDERTVWNVPVLGEGGDALIPFGGLGHVNTRTTFAYRNRDGFVDVADNLTVAPTAFAGTTAPGSGATNLDDVDRWALHHRTQWVPTDRLTFDYIYDRTHVDEEPTAYQLSAVSGAGTPFLLSPFLTSRRAEVVAANYGAFDGANPRPLESKLDIQGHALTGTLELPTLPVVGDVTVKSISAYRTKENDEAADIDGTGFQFFESGIKVDHEQFSQELQVNGDTAQGLFQYVAGFYYFNENGRAINDQDFLQDPFFAGSGFTVDFLHKFEKESFAGYAQGDLTLPVWGDRITLSGGVRYTNEDVEIDVLNVNSAAGTLIDTGIGGTPNVAKPKDTWDNWSWLARVQVQFTDDLMAYYKANTGFLAGGFNARNVNPANFGTPYSPEKLLSHELGFRGDFFRRRVRLNATWFYYDYEDIQVSVFDPGTGGATTLVQNAAEARIWGAEIDVLAQVFDGAEVQASYGYTHPEYRNFIDPVLGDVTNVRGFAQTPEHSVTVGGSYTLPAFSWGTVMARVDWSWSDEVIFSDTPSAAIDQTKPFWTLNAMLQVSDIELPCATGRLRTMAWMRNITDEDYKEFGFSLLGAFGGEGIAVNTYTDPRTYGLTLVWEWEK